MTKKNRFANCSGELDIESFRQRATLLGSAEMAQASCKRCKEEVAGEELECPRCGGPFHCGAQDPGPCPCTTVTLSPAQLEALRRRYTGCLCLRCLQQPAWSNLEPKRLVPGIRGEPNDEIFIRDGRMELHNGSATVEAVT